MPNNYIRPNSTSTDSETNHLATMTKELADSVKLLAKTLNECNEDIKCMTEALCNLNNRIIVLEEKLDEEDELDSYLNKNTTDITLETAINIDNETPVTNMETDEFKTIRSPHRDNDKKFRENLNQLKRDSAYLKERQTNLEGTTANISGIMSNLYKKFFASDNPNVEPDTTLNNSNAAGPSGSSSSVV